MAIGESPKLCDDIKSAVPTTSNAQSSDDNEQNPKQICVLLSTTLLQMQTFEKNTFLIDICEQRDPSKVPSVAPFDSLELSSIEGLRLNEKNKGKYVILRIIESSEKLLPGLTAIEDHKGNCVWSLVFNFPKCEEKSFEVGNVVLIKEPFMYLCSVDYIGKLSYLEILTPVIVCECPTDIIPVNVSHHLYHLVKNIEWRETIEKVDLPTEAKNEEENKSHEYWRSLANEYRDKKHYVHHRTCLLKVVEVSEKGSYEWNIALLQLSKLHFSCSYFEKTQDCLNTILTESPDDSEVLLLAAEAAYALEDYTLADTQCKKALQLGLTGKSKVRAEAKQQDILYRLAEQNGGLYSVGVMKGLGLRLESVCADYTSLVKLVDIPGKGRGLVLTKNAFPKTLLLVSKALASVNTMMTKLQDMVINLVVKNPKKWAPIIYQLQATKQRSVNSPGLQQHCNPETMTEPICYSEIIKEIVKCNLVLIKDQICLKTGCKKFRKKKLIRLIRGMGLFYFPSFINHSCCPNTYTLFLNDVMFIYSKVYLSAGNEITMNYLPEQYLKKDDRKKLLMTRDIVCHCAICDPQLLD